MNLRQIAFHDHPSGVFTTLAAVTSAFAFSPTSTILPVILALSVLLVYSPIVFRPQPKRLVNVSLLLAGLTAGSSVSRIRPSLNALSSPGVSLLALFSTSAIIASLALLSLFLSTKLTTRLTSSSAQLTIFPAIWATLWCAIAHLSPEGYFSTWSIANNFDAYCWMTAFVGTSGKDWMVGAWAVVISQTIGHWFIGSNFEDQLEDDNDVDLFHQQSLNHKQGPTTNIAGISILALFLTGLTIPSFILSDLPLPVSSIEAVTPLSIGCVLPPYNRVKHHVLTVEDYIVETNQISNRVQVALWPEGAVTFNSVEERDKGFADIRQRVRGPFIGVSFEETIPDPNDPTGREHITRTGLAIVSNRSTEPYLTYYKRHLVPVAESYRLEHSSLPPTLFEAQLPKPSKSIANSDWGSSPGYTRPLLLTASICLDFAMPSPFSALDARPGLILAPARTWHPTVGHAMWLQAKQRAEELGSMVLWCDGGEGGVSGVAGGGFNEVAQVGSGSFVQTVGVQYPFDSRRTFYARYGDSVLILFWVFIAGSNVLRIPLGPFKDARKNLLKFIRRRQGRQAQIENIEEQDLLG